MTDPRRRAAEAIYNAMLQAQRDAGDAALCEALDLLAADTGQNKFRFAASVLRGTTLGRLAINDAEALRRITAFPPARRREAVGVVARQVAGAEANPARVDAIAHRLRRKLRENETDKKVLSANPAL
ncbi:hypothetical protein [Bradyrhizobium sp. Ash2021]|uniref:hypothetical protein n=1 Tax=Bradyrhizobium sp. Ash2021 TaxID=2954771 RepID=UPI0028154EF5|nr:hypothetical protein [Bradyrhizobium sp. Ash2021]WMT78858.1 hypothetical protein NL528_22040 [Bradyrhizobium sp. Ash2021]